MPNNGRWSAARSTSGAAPAVAALAQPSPGRPLTYPWAYYTRVRSSRYVTGLTSDARWHSYNLSSSRCPFSEYSSGLCVLYERSRCISLSSWLRIGSVKGAAPGVSSGKPTTWVGNQSDDSRGRLLYSSELRHQMMMSSSRIERALWWLLWMNLMIFITSTNFLTYFWKYDRRLMNAWWFLFDFWKKLLEIDMTIVIRKKMSFITRLGERNTIRPSFLPTRSRLCIDFFLKMCIGVIFIYSRLFENRGPRSCIHFSWNGGPKV